MTSAVEEPCPNTATTEESEAVRLERERACCRAPSDVPELHVLHVWKRMRDVPLPVFNPAFISRVPPFLLVAPEVAEPALIVSPEPNVSAVTLRATVNARAACPFTLMSVSKVGAVERTTFPVPVSGRNTASQDAPKAATLVAVPVWPDKFHSRLSRTKWSL